MNSYNKTKHTKYTLQFKYNTKKNIYTENKNIRNNNLLNKTRISFCDFLYASIPYELEK